MDGSYCLTEKEKGLWIMLIAALKLLHIIQVFRG